MNVVVTDRLLLRRMTLEDGELIIALLNDPDFLRFVGDRQVRSPDDAREYLLSGPIDSYTRHGFGLYAVILKDEGAAIGMCGLLKREYLPAPDIGFAFLSAWRSRGLAREAAQAVLADAALKLRLPRVLAIVDPDNARSIRLLERLGLHKSAMLPPGADGASLACYAIDLARDGAGPPFA